MDVSYHVTVEKLDDGHFKCVTESDIYEGIYADLLSKIPEEDYDKVKPIMEEATESVCNAVAKVITDVMTVWPGITL